MNFHLHQQPPPSVVYLDVEKNEMRKTEKQLPNSSQYSQDLVVGSQYRQPVFPNKQPINIFDSFPFLNVKY